MKIPEVREHLRTIAGELEALGDRDHARKIRYLVTELVRRKAVRIAPVKARRVNGKVADRIRDEFYENPNASQQEIATRIGVTAGRVSEAVAGKRT